MDARVKPAHDELRKRSIHITSSCTITFLILHNNLPSLAAFLRPSFATLLRRGTRWLVRSLYFPVFLRIRNLPSPVSRSQAHTPPPSRGAFSAPGVCNFASLTPNEGWAERRETFGCLRSTRGACPRCVTRRA